MRIKKFTAGSMREALMQIKSELGEEAIILKTRKLPKKVFPLGSHDEVEVTAAIDESAPSPPAMPPITLGSTGVYGRPRPLSPVSSIIDPDQPGTPEIKRWEPPRASGRDEDARQKSSPRRSDDRHDQQELMELKENVRELRELVKGIMKEESGTVSDNGFTGGWAILHQRLLDAEVKPDIAGELVKKVSSSDIMLSDSQAEKKFTSSLGAILPVAGPLKLKKDEPLVVAFIGPTGSGKTTTLAKLAAHCRITRKKKVSIITADTYRIAAIEQIRMFADIIKVGIQVVFSPEEVPAALEACASDDIVLVDTAGRSQRNTEHMTDLHTFMEALGADEVHLVLSATTKDSDLLDCVERYRKAGVNRLLFTKLDETARVGNILNVVRQTGVAMSYFTNGQSVPDDIEVAQTSRFIRRLLEGSPL
ncbi:MAG: flagellar biosynthesis protein FlhF [Chitinispirillaceae bacterium]|nr:flagellar biosynthesis protein FlhF [Chitinispirillaceae bacterium]